MLRIQSYIKLGKPVGSRHVAQHSLSSLLPSLLSIPHIPYSGSCSSFTSVSFVWSICSQNLFGKLPLSCTRLLSVTNSLPFRSSHSKSSTHSRSTAFHYLPTLDGSRLFGFSTTYASRSWGAAFLFSRSTAAEATSGRVLSSGSNCKFPFQASEFGHSVSTVHSSTAKTCSTMRANFL